MRIGHGVVLFCLSVGLLACSNDPNDLPVEEFIKTVEKQEGVVVPPIAEPERYPDFEYTSENLRSPFDPESKGGKGGGAMQADFENRQKNLPPDADRPRELLESYPVDSLNMVGTLRRGEEVWGLVVDKSGFIHKVRVGNYLGQHSGKIQEITADTIYIEELIQGPGGKWLHREALLKMGK